MNYSEWNIFRYFIHDFEAHIILCSQFTPYQNWSVNTEYWVVTKQNHSMVSGTKTITVIYRHRDTSQSSVVCFCMLALSRNRFLLRDIPSHIAKHVARIDLKKNSDCDANERTEHLISNCTAKTEIPANHLGKNIIDEGEIPSLQPSQLLQFSKALKLNGEL